MPDTEVQPAPETGVGNDDVRADVLAAFEKLRDEPPTPEPAAASSEADASPERLRNERGQFTKADGAETPAAVAAEPVPDADPSPDKPEQPSTAVEHPKTWSADAKAEWSKLPPAVQQAVLKRETEIDAGGRRWSEEKRQYDDVLNPVRGLASRHGVDERETINRLLSANDWLERDPAGAIRAFAQAYGVDLSAPSNSNAQPQPQADPNFARLQNEVTGLRQTIQQRETAEAASAIEGFATAPGHEHFEAVKARMGQLIGSGQANSLEEAYEQAIWSNPAIRPQLIAAQTAQVANERRAADQAAVAKAKSGALSLSGSPAGAGAPVVRPQYDTVEDAARAAYRQLAAG